MRYTDFTPTRKIGHNTHEIRYSIRRRVNMVCNKLDRLYEEKDRKQTRTRELLGLGITDAKVYWMRKDDPDSKPDQLELTPAANSEYAKQNRTRREYIGVKAEKIQAALDRVERGKEYRRLSREVDQISSKIKRIGQQIDTLDMVTFGKQQSFIKEFND